MGMMAGNQPYSARMQGMGQGASSNMMRQRMMMGGGATGQPSAQGPMMSHMGRAPQQQQPNQGQPTANQQAQGQQQMMHSGNQGMYPQPPPY